MCKIDEMYSQRRVQHWDQQRVEDTVSGTMPPIWRCKIDHIRNLRKTQECVGTGKSLVKNKCHMHVQAIKVIVRIIGSEVEKEQRRNMRRNVNLIILMYK